MKARVESRQLRRHVVRIDRVEGPPLGSGFFVAPGWVLTCAHVVYDTARSAEIADVVVVPDSSVGSGPLPATVVSRSSPGAGAALWPFPDLALVRLSTPCAHPCAWLDARDPGGDAECTSWGHARRETGVDPVGSPASFGFEGVEGDGYLKLKAGEAAAGLSGAPLVCPVRRGVVGVVTAT